MIVKRELYNYIQPYIVSKQAIIVTGMRRVGKTTLLKTIFDEIESPNKQYLDLENVVNQRLFAETDYEQIKRSLELLGMDFKKELFLFLDEIQFVKNLPSVVKYVSDHYPVKFFLTGSASFYLKNLFSESLAGRKYLFELFPFSFREFLAFKEPSMRPPEMNDEAAGSLYDRLAPLYKEYMEFGGFPEVIAAESKAEKEKRLDDIFSSYIHLEVRGLSDFRKMDVMRDLITLLAGRAGSALDVKKISSALAASRKTIMDYIAFLEGTYFISRVRPFSHSRDVEIRKTPKLYLCDSGFANRFGKIGEGALFEQSVYQLLRLRGAVQYYQTKTGSEIDFIVNQKAAFEAKTRGDERDAARIEKTARALGFPEWRVVSLERSSAKNTVYGFHL